MSTPHRHGHLPPRLSFRAASLFEAHGQLAEAERRRLALREQLVQHLGGAARHGAAGRHDGGACNFVSCSKT